jgi:hypothetical protein
MNRFCEDHAVAAFNSRRHARRAGRRTPRRWTSISWHERRVRVPSVAKTNVGKQRARGSVEELPSGGYRVRVYAGVDPVAGRDHYLRETVPAGPRADREAKKVRTRLLFEIDERRNPRTNATVGQLPDRHLEMAELDQSTLETYRGYVKKHIRPLLGGKGWGYWTRTSWTPSSFDVVAGIVQAARRLIIARGSHTAVMNAACLISAVHFQRLRPTDPLHSQRYAVSGQSAGSGLRRARWLTPTRAFAPQAKSSATNRYRGSPHPQRGVEGPGLGHAGSGSP